MCYGQQVLEDGFELTVRRMHLTDPSTLMPPGSKNYLCDQCDPDLMGIVEGRIQIVETYMDPLTHVGNYCNAKVENQITDF
jgi:hypothetical protein